MRHNGNPAYAFCVINQTFRLPRSRRQLLSAQNQHIALWRADFDAWNNQNVRISRSQLNRSLATSYAVMIGYSCNLNETVSYKLVNQSFRLNKGITRINSVNM